MQLRQNVLHEMRFVPIAERIAGAPRKPADRGGLSENIRQEIFNSVEVTEKCVLVCIYRRIRMVIAVDADHISFVIRPFDNIPIADYVGADHEKSGVNTVSFQSVEQLDRILGGAVVKGKIGNF